LCCSLPLVRTVAYCTRVNPDENVLGVSVGTMLDGDLERDQCNPPPIP
jgi:hypothetical protein